MRYLKTYENNTPSISELEYKFIMGFKSEENFLQWCVDVNDVDDPDLIDWDNIIGWYLPIEFGLPTYNNDIIEILSDVATIDLDDLSYDDLRSGKITYNEWKEVNKYNL